MKKIVLLPLLAILATSIAIGISMGYHFLVPFFLGVVLSALTTIGLTQITYFTIPKTSKPELKDEFKLRLQQSLMDISDSEASDTAQVMIEVLDRLI